MKLDDFPFPLKTSVTFATLKKWFIILVLTAINFVPARAQQLSEEEKREIILTSPLPDKFRNLHKERLWLVGGTFVGGTTVSLLLLNNAWYKNYERTSFHTFNDFHEWKQMDKAGHAFSAFITSHIIADLWQWTGLPKEKAVWISSISSFGYMTAIEFLDAHSAKWGWSWSDVGANFMGTAIFATQEHYWKEQRIQLKFSTHNRHYDASLKKRAHDLFGSDLPSRILKDYNGQTYWASFNLNSFLPDTKWPSWLNIALGYGAEGMFGGFENIAFDKNGSRTFYRPDIKRYRQWYIAPDIALSRIKTRNKFLKSTFAVLNILKIPAPAIEWSNGKIRGHILYF
ncbi:MAG: DUF2279 domain-containing protein [Flavisolibacter sp.]|nr:DUF2279 domain-containing protein [Flavisolibacter sp.]